MRKTICLFIAVFFISLLLLAQEAPLNDVQRETRPIKSREVVLSLQLAFSQAQTAQERLEKVTAQAQLAAQMFTTAVRDYVISQGLNPDEWDINLVQGILLKKEVEEEKEAIKPKEP
tara:strand:- start:110 stop:460 length:351 start_codon:yes stop_codon:yes gene_type:complete